MRLHSVAGRGVAPSAVNEPHAALWNASTTRQIYLVKLDLANSGAANLTFGLQRTSTRGTAGSTVTPDIDNDVDRSIDDVSGTVLDLADFTAVPTFQGPYWMRTILNQNSALNLVFNIPIAIPQNTGFALEALVGLQAVDSAWTWEE